MQSICGPSDAMSLKVSSAPGPSLDPLSTVYVTPRSRRLPGARVAEPQKMPECQAFCPLGAWFPHSLARDAGPARRPPFPQASRCPGATPAWSPIQSAIHSPFPGLLSPRWWPLCAEAPCPPEPGTCVSSSPPAAVPAAVSPSRGVCVVGGVGGSGEAGGAASVLFLPASCCGP